MHAPPRLRLEPRPSRIGLALVSSAFLAAAALVAALPLPFAFSAACLTAIGLGFLRGVRRCAGPAVPAIVHLGIDRTLTVTDRRGRSRDGVVGADSYVGAALTTIAWRANGAPWWRPADVLLVFPDSIPADDFRCLRIFLRYGRPADEGATSGADAA